jgi:hypothetical protein
MLLLLIVGNYTLLRFILLWCCNTHTKLRQSVLDGSKCEAGCVCDTHTHTHTHTLHTHTHTHTHTQNMQSSVYFSYRSSQEPPFQFQWCTDQRMVCNLAFCSSRLKLCFFYVCGILFCGNITELTTTSNTTTIYHEAIRCFPCTTSFGFSGP